MSVLRIMAPLMFVGVAACSAPEPDGASSLAEDLAAVRQVLHDWIADVEDNDGRNYGDFLTEDFVYLGPDAPAVEGKATVVPWVAGFFERLTFDFPETVTESVVIDGDLAVHYYAAVAVTTPRAGGDPSSFDRKYIDVLRRQPDGSWKVSHHIFNLN